MSAETFDPCGAYVKEAEGYNCARCGWGQEHHASAAVADVALRKPSVGQAVHYVSHGTPPRADGSQAYPSTCRAAIITEVWFSDPELTQPSGDVSLAVLNPTALHFGEHVHHDPGGISVTEGAPIVHSYEGGTWHWPERV